MVQLGAYRSNEFCHTNFFLAFIAVMRLNFLQVLHEDLNQSVALQDVKLKQNLSHYSSTK